MICCGWGMDDADADLNLVADDLELIALIKPTHVSLGVNSIRAAEDEHRWALTNTIKAHGQRWSDALHKMGCTVGTHAWMVGSERFVRDAAAGIASLHEQWGCGFDYPNPEEPWRGTTNAQALARHVKRGYAKKAQMLRVAAQADHDRLGRLYVEELRRHGCTSDVWPAVTNAGPVQMRSMIEASTGACHQMMAFHNPKGHSTPKPPGRQQTAWRQIHRVWGHKGRDHITWGQHALYHQWPGLPPEQWAIRSIDAALDQAKGAHEANVALWSLYWIKRQPWAARVAASYSPRQGRMYGWD